MTKQIKSPSSFWTQEATQVLQGKVVSHIEYLSAKEKLNFDWSKSAPIIVFTDGTRLMPVVDEELNEAGSFYFCRNNQGQVIPSI